MQATGEAGLQHLSRVHDAKCIQRFARAKVSAQKAQKLREHMPKFHMVVLQALWRGYSSRKATKELRNRRTEAFEGAAGVIKRWWQRRRMERRQAAAIRIQSQWRAGVARAPYRSQKAEVCVCTPAPGRWQDPPRHTLPHLVVYGGVPRLP